VHSRYAINATLDQPRMNYGIDRFISLLKVEAWSVLASNITRWVASYKVVQFLRLHSPRGTSESQMS